MSIMCGNHWKAGIPQSSAIINGRECVAIQKVGYLKIEKLSRANKNSREV